MSLKYRKERIKKISNSWDLKIIHDLMVSYKIPKNDFQELLKCTKLYISKALNFPFTIDDLAFLKLVDKQKTYRKNITPNGGVVPKREFQLEYNMILRTWASIVKKMTSNDEKLLKLFRTTPNIRIKFGKELKDNVGRGLSTSIPHSDAWVEGPWGMNCFVPLMGDTKRNNLVCYEPKNKFKEEFLETSPTYDKMQWVLKEYKPITRLKPTSGNLYISDYALIHNTNRKLKSKTRISIDTTVFVGNHKPHKDRLPEYRDIIPQTGIDEFIDVGQYENEKFVEKNSVFSHYTSKVLKTLKL